MLLFVNVALCFSLIFYVWLCEPVLRPVCITFVNFSAVVAMDRSQKTFIWLIFLGDPIDQWPLKAYVGFVLDGSWRPSECVGVTPEELEDGIDHT